MVEVLNFSSLLLGTYLEALFSVDFEDNSDLWLSDMDDSELLHVAEHSERYSPTVEDISMEDCELYSAVGQIESA